MTCLFLSRPSHRNCDFTLSDRDSTSELHTSELQLPSFQTRSSVHLNAPSCAQTTPSNHRLCNNHLSNNLHNNDHATHV